MKKNPESVIYVFVCEKEKHLNSFEITVTIFKA